MISDEQRSAGAIIFHLFGTLYFFVLLSIVCNDYFLPSVECVCEDLNISKVIQSILSSHLKSHNQINCYTICVGCCSGNVHGISNYSTGVFCKYNFIVCGGVRCWSRRSFGFAHVQCVGCCGICWDGRHSLRSIGLVAHNSRLHDVYTEHFCSDLCRLGWSSYACRVYNYGVNGFDVLYGVTFQ